MSRWLAALAAMMLWCVPARSQIGQQASAAANPLNISLAAQDAGTCAAGSAAIQQLPLNAGTSTVTLAGTFSATVTVRLSANGGATWVNQGTQNSAGTISYVVAGFTFICVDPTTYSNGIVNVTINSSTATGPGGVPVTVVAGLNSITGRGKGTVAAVTDGASATDCTTGGGSTVVVCQYSGTAWAQMVAASSGATGFAAITGGTNTAALVMGTGGSLGTSGTGTINANQLNGAAAPVSKTIVGTNSSGQLTDASSATLANNTTGTAANLTAAALLPTGTTANTPSAGDNSVNISTTQYVDRIPKTKTLGWAYGDLATGSALTTSEVGYITVPFACTITGFHVMADAGTVTIKTARVNGGTALPTVASNSISTSGVSLSSGTKVDSTTVTDFTSTAIAANDTLGFFITAVATAKQITFQLDCKTQ